MADKDFFNTPDDDLLLDELIEETKQQINAAPEEPYHSAEDSAAEFPDAFPAEEPLTMPTFRQEDAETPSEPEDFFTPPEFPPDFVPDFGDAFDDYGEYVEQPPQEPYEPDDEEPPEKPKRSRKKRLVPLPVKILLYLVIVGVAALGIGYGIWECAQDVLAFGRSEEMLTVVIGENDTVEDISEMLKEKGVIKYPWLFRLYCDFTDSNEKFDPGIYEIYYNYDYHALVSGMIATSPNRVTVRVTIPEGRTAAQIFALMEENGICTVAELERCAAQTHFDYWFLEGIPYGNANRLEGFLFPDTYDFYENDDPERVLDKLLTNFNRKFSKKAEEQLEALNVMMAERLSSAGYDEAYIEAHRFTIYELITVASMIERETAGVSESGNISSVIYNRLCRPADYPYLNIDATVVYALGGVTRPLTEEDLQVDSPYNTYLYSGLPAGPIANPGLNSITAALNPFDTTYYYYALDKSTGEHHFSSTYDEHNAFLGSQSDDEE